MKVRFIDKGNKSNEKSGEKSGERSHAEISSKITYAENAIR